MSVSFVLAVVAGLGFLGLFSLRQVLRREFPDVARIKTQYPVVSYRGPGVPPLVTLQRTRPSSWIALNEVSRAAVGAVLVSEDWAFYQHRGYDPNQIKEALKKDLEEGGYARGASTITQQVVKNIFLGPDKTIWRKLKELYLAVSLEEALKKNRILELYLNIAEWGPGVFGIGGASQLYFKKAPLELTAKEGAFLAMLLPSPIRYGQSYRAKKLTDYAASTIEAILSKMVQANYLTEEEQAREVARRLSFEETSLDPGLRIPQNQE